MTCITIILVAFLAACSGCHPTPSPVTPQPLGDAGVSSCAQVCQLAADNSCDWGANCQLACDNAVTTGFAAWNVGCRASKLRAHDCNAADACER